jgi:apolipoprotein N-acyltransferase
MPLFAALVAGLLLCASDHPLRLWWLQLVALVPFWFALSTARSARAAWPMGTLLGIGYAAPLVVAMGPAPPILVAAAANVLQWTLVAALAAKLLPRGPVLGPLAAAAALTLVEVAVWYCVPMFGTAQCFVRPLTAAPWLVGFVAWPGVAGLVFVLAATQALAVQAIGGPHRTLPIVSIAAMVALVVGLDIVRWQRPLGPAVTVATIGWNRDSGEFDRDFTGLAARAKDHGAVLLVTPETGVDVGHVPRERSLAWLAGIAKPHALTLAIGVWHGPTHDNRIWFVGPDGALQGEYRKTHLIPWLERYEAGDGTLFHGTVGDSSLGGMICQDDNFTDLARTYGRASTRLLAVPTNDWPKICAFHLENGIFRAIENGYAVARATSGGISALLSPRGEVVQQFDHIERGFGVLTGPLPTGDGEVTFYARFGDLPMVLLCLVLTGCALLRRRPAA